MNENWEKKKRNLETLGWHIFGPGPVKDHESKGPFEDAVSRYFKAPIGARVEVEIVGSHEYQIGDYTWETDPGHVDIKVVWWVQQADGSLKQESRSNQFDTISDLWKALR